MKRCSRPPRRAWLAALAAGLTCAPLPAQTLPFEGRWAPVAAAAAATASAAAPASPAAAAPAGYTLLTIDAGRMTWSGPRKSTPPCVQAFATRPERPGSVYLDGRGTRFVAGAKGSLPTYPLVLGALACGGLSRDARISFPLVYDTEHIDFIEYVNGRPVSARRFRRKR